MAARVNAQIINPALRVQLHTRVILTLMYPGSLHCLRPSETSPRSATGEAEGTRCHWLALSPEMVGAGRELSKWAGWWGRWTLSNRSLCHEG